MIERVRRTSLAVELVHRCRSMQRAGCSNILVSAPKGETAIFGVPGEVIDRAKWILSFPVAPLLDAAFQKAAKEG